MIEHDLVDRLRLDYPGREMRTWLNNFPSSQVRSYLDRVLEKPILNSFLVPRSTGWSRPTINLLWSVCG